MNSPFIIQSKNKKLNQDELIHGNNVLVAQQLLNQCEEIETHLENMTKDTMHDNLLYIKTKILVGRIKANCEFSKIKDIEKLKETNVVLKIP